MEPDETQNENSSQNIPVREQLILPLFFLFTYLQGFSKQEVVGFNYSNQQVKTPPAAFRQVAFVKARFSLLDLFSLSLLSSDKLSLVLAVNRKAIVPPTANNACCFA